MLSSIRPVSPPGLGPIQLVGQPFTLSQHANALRTAPPERGQDTAAVLIELGYLSNPGDAGQMQTEAWRAKVAAAIATAVDRQFMTAADLGPPTIRSTQ